MDNLLQNNSQIFFLLLFHKQQRTYFAISKQHAFKLRFMLITAVYFQIQSFTPSIQDLFHKNSKQCIVLTLLTAQIITLCPK